MTSKTFFFIFIPILAIILLAVNLIFAPHNPYQEKDSAFECGFHSFLGQNRTQFSISFFIFALLFLLFDLEILLIYPYVVSAHTNGIYGLAVMLLFFLALTLGFAFELGKNALKIDSRQMVTLNSNNTQNINTFISGFIPRGSGGSKDSDSDDSDTTPTNGSVEGSEGGDTPTNERVDEQAETRNTLELVKRVAKGEDISRQDLENIKEEFSSYFEEDKTEKEAYNDIIEELEGEVSSFGKQSLTGLKEALDDLASSRDGSGKSVKSSTTATDNTTGTSSSTSDSEAPLVSSSSLKRKLEGDNESSVQPANKPFKQDSSDITSEGDMPSYT